MSSIRDQLPEHLRALADGPIIEPMEDERMPLGTATIVGPDGIGGVIVNIDKAGTLCVLCGKPIESLRNAHARVTGWEKRRTGGGTNAVRCRQPSDEWAHDHCVDRAASGVAPLQEELL